MLTVSPLASASNACHSSASVGSLEASASSVSALPTTRDVLGRVRARIDFLERPYRDLGVDRGGLKVRVPEHRLDEADVGVAPQPAL